jgi:hypothetical protein
MPYSIKIYLCLFAILLLAKGYAQPNSPANSRQALESLVKKTGEIFVSVDAFQEQHNKICTIENVFSNGIAIKGDTVKINYLNYTESFCEAFVLQSKMIYTFSLKDLEPAKLLLTQRNYNVGKGKLTDGQAIWYEIHLFTRQQKPLIAMRDLDTRKTEHVSEMRLLFKTKEAAQKGLVHLRSLVGEASKS